METISPEKPIKAIKRRGAGKSKITGSFLPPPKPKKKKPSTIKIPSGFDVGKAVSLRLKNHLSYEAIGKIMGVTKQCIQQRIQTHIELFDDPELSQAYTENKERIMASAESRFLVAALDKEKMDQASSLQCVTAVGILYDKQRLERGLSTDNISIRSVHGQIQAKLKDLSDRKDKLTFELHSLADIVDK